MLQSLSFITLFWIFLSSQVQSESHNSEAIILVHGLARTANSMKPLADKLKQHGYATHLLSYPSRTARIESLTENYLKPLVIQIQSHGYRKIHFVTHSMGGILVRYLLAHHTITNIGAVVMLAPPNKGSQIVDTIGHWKIFNSINGPAGKQLGTKSTGFIQQLPNPNYPIYIIAGNRSINPINSLIIPGKDDGKVSLQNTHIDGSIGHVILHRSHAMIMYSPETIRHTLKFLQNHRNIHTW